MSSAPEGLGIDKVHVWRGERHVLKGLSLELKRQELLHVTGPNGTGKTTLLRVASGLLRPEQGTVKWFGQPLSRAGAAFHTALAYASHEPALKGDLTPLENLKFMIGLKRAVGAPELLSVLERAGVAACAGLPVRVLSAGQRRRVAIARVLASRAALWLLDEPFTNLDAAGSTLLAGLLMDHVKGGGMAIVVAHHELNISADGVRRLDLGA